MSNYWFSFSYKGDNVGVCIVQAESIDEALIKTKKLKIHPTSDNIRVYEFDSLKDDDKLSLNRLYFKQEMIELGYLPQVVIK